MRKLLCILLALLLVSVTLLTACDTGSTTPSATTTPSANNSSGGNGGGNGSGNQTSDIPSTPPTGYAFHTEGNFRFAYPDLWQYEPVVDRDDVALFTTRAEDEIMMTIYYGNDLFQDMSEEELRDHFSDGAMDVSSVKNIGWETNELGLSVYVISFHSTLQIRPVDYYIFSVTVDEVAYTLVLNDYDGSLAETAEVIFQSMVDLSAAADNGGTEPTPNPNPTPDPNAPTGYKTFPNYNLRFAYPDAWTTDSSANSRDVVINGGSNFRLYLHSSPKTTMFDDLTDDSFRDTYVEGLQQQYGGTIDSATVEYRETDNGLLVAIIMFSITTENAIEGEIWYCVTIDETTHCLILRTAVEDETLFVTIFNSLTATDGPNVSNGSESDPGTSTKPEGTDPGTSTKPEGTDPGPSTKPEDSNPEGTDPGKKGYSYYTDGDLQILIPVSWNPKELQDKQGNNLQIQTGDNIQVFQNLSAQTFETLMSDYLGSEYTLLNVKSALMENANGIDVNCFTYLIIYNQMTMRQYLYAFQLNDTPYVLILTQVAPDEEYAELLFDSIENLNPETSKPSDNIGTQTKETYNLSFHYPSDWSEEYESLVSASKYSNIDFTAGVKTDLFSTMTEDFFMEHLAPMLTSENDIEISKVFVKHETNPNGLLVSAIYLDLEIYGMNAQQIWFSVTIGETTHLITLTAIFDSTEEIEHTLFNSFTAINGPEYVGDNTWELE